MPIEVFIRLYTPYFTPENVEYLFWLLPHRRITEEAKRHNGTTYGCSAVTYQKGDGYSDMNLICLYRINLSRECQREHLRHFLHFYSRGGKGAADAFQDICETYGVDVILQKSCENWFTKFCSRNFSLKEEQRSGQPVGTDEGHLMGLIEADRHTTVRVLAEKTHYLLEQFTIMSRDLRPDSSTIPPVSSYRGFTVSAYAVNT
ncbi:unnamed protein product [Heligmosomoides polygyrus]|uniref:HTH_48 domain-containing protein n=1 Tax=Heligmosomoides polygyrus TaxID=6339 RepID=A0A183F7V6_HELPZ|nr:unnamed protein product [Heligmosomoides polygyrus]